MPKEHDELDEILGEEKETPLTPSDDESEEDESEKSDENQDDEDEDEKDDEDPEIKRKTEHKEKLDKAIAEGNAELRKIRKGIKKAKKGDDDSDEDDEEDELPKIDETDPNTRAWDRHVNKKVKPITDEAEKEKEEIRTFALKDFLADKPKLARNPEKVKRLLTTYQTLSAGKITEKTREGITTYLRKAYAAEFEDEIFDEQNRERVNAAKARGEFSEVAISRGDSTNYPQERDSTIVKISRSDEQMLAKWGMTPQEWAKQKKAQDKKKLGN